MKKEGTHVNDEGDCPAWCPACRRQKGNEMKASTVKVVDFGKEPVGETELEVAQRLITEECDELKALLLAKNSAYGNSALDPVRIFSKADAAEQIRVRLDDKLSRIKRGSAAGEDVEKDILGYLILLRVLRKRGASK